MNNIKVAWQYCLPQHLLSRLAGIIANATCPRLRRLLIRYAIKHYQIDVSEAIYTNLEQYKSFNDFFTRELRDDARPIDKSYQSVVSPADGSICRFGAIEDQQLIEAKGHLYTLNELLGETSEYSDALEAGEAMTIYLAPKDYHRVHLPLAGQLMRMVYIPGRLFSVNPLTTKTVSGLFARNERVVCYFKTKVGIIAVVLVGAMLVASIKVAWAGLVAPSRDKIIKTWDYGTDAMQFEQGQEIAQFCFGSTAIVLFPKRSMTFDTSLQLNDSIRMGQIIGKLSE